MNSEGEFDGTIDRWSAEREDDFRDPDCGFGPRDMQGEYTESLARGEHPEIYSVVSAARGEGMTVMYIPEARRAGVCWGADTYWTDAGGPEEAVCRFFSNTMIE